MNYPFKEWIKKPELLKSPFCFKNNHKTKISIRGKDAKSVRVLTRMQPWQSRMGGRVTDTLALLSDSPDPDPDWAIVRESRGPNWQFLWEGLGLWQWTSFIQKWNRDYISPLNTKPKTIHAHTPHNMCLTDGHTHPEPICHCDFRHPHIHCDLDTHTCSLSICHT